MARKPRRALWTDVACYHVFNRGHNRETVFHDDEDRRFFLGLLRKYRERFDARLYHYCLMDNHYHLAVQLGDAKKLSSMMAGIGLSYVHHARRRYGFVGHLWQGRFKSLAIEMDGYLLSCGRYVERNPLEGGLAESPWEYAWSSCRAYALGEPDALLAEHPLYEELAETAARRRQLWREFLLDDDPKQEEIRQQEWLIGEGDLRRASTRHRGRAQPRGRGRPAKPVRADR